MKLVEFEDGTFGVRKGYWIYGYYYLDLTCSLHAWDSKSKFFKDCKGTKEDAIRMRLIRQEELKTVRAASRKHKHKVIDE